MTERKLPPEDAAHVAEMRAELAATGEFETYRPDHGGVPAPPKGKPAPERAFWAGEG